VCRERGTDPFDASQVCERAKWSVQLAVGDDPPGQHHANPGERIELFGRGDVDIDGKERPDAGRRHVRHRSGRARIVRGHCVRGQPMPPLSPSCFALYGRARRIDGGELAVERFGRGWRTLFDGADGAQGAHGCAKEGDAGEKEQSFFFGGRWHARSLTKPLSECRITSIRAGPKRGNTIDVRDPGLARD
jgi:hypothetical protein